MNNKKIKIALIIAAILIVVSFGFRFASDVRSSVADNILGFAWSENIGWISFNSVNCDIDGDGTYEGAGETGGPAPAGCPIAGVVSSYGVNLNMASKNLSGYAWSENIGWISFQLPDLSGCPAAPCQPRYDSGTGEVLGWARALANGGGWDGWIKLRKDSGDSGSDYGVSLAGADFTGWAWGSDVTGWICFNNLTPGCDLGAAGPNYKVYLANSSPVLTVQAPVIPDYCANPPQAIILSWDFNDAEDETVHAYQLKVTRNGSWIYDSGKRVSPTTSVIGTAINAESGYAGFIDYNYSYAWEVTVWDSADASDGPKAGTNFSTPVHIYPTTDFICSPSSTSCPSRHSRLEPINFTDESVCYDNSNDPVTCSSWNWDFGDGSSSNDQNPAYAYTARGSYAARLITTDPSGIACPESVPINIGAVSPKWKEVIPR